MAWFWLLYLSFLVFLGEKTARLKYFFFFRWEDAHQTEIYSSFFHLFLDMRACLMICLFDLISIRTSFVMEEDTPNEKFNRLLTCAPPLLFLIFSSCKSLWYDVVTIADHLFSFNSSRTIVGVTTYNFYFCLLWCLLFSSFLQGVFLSLYISCGRLPGFDPIFMSSLV